MSKTKNYEEEIELLKNNAEKNAKEFEGDSRVWAQMNHSYYLTVAEIMEETILKLDNAIKDNNQNWD